MLRRLAWCVLLGGCAHLSTPADLRERAPFVRATFPERSQTAVTRCLGRQLLTARSPAGETAPWIADELGVRYSLFQTTMIHLEVEEAAGAVELTGHGLQGPVDAYGPSILKAISRCDGRPR